MATDAGDDFINWMVDLVDFAEWIAVDWGTSNLRAWVFGPDNTLLAQHSSGLGMGSLSPDQFEQTLIELVGRNLGEIPTPVICCGMVGARQGWQDAGYVYVPCAPPKVTQAIQANAKDPCIIPVILPGMQQNKPADVMRGEETQIAGFLASNSDFDGVLCLPGTHTKWVRISAGEVVSFSTYMTGEMFALLCTGSVLRHSVLTEAWDETAFGDAVNDAISRPQNLGSGLFGLRAETLVNDMPAATAKSRLSGMLIGLELAGARPYWLGQNIAIVGDRKLSMHYKTALESQGAPAELADGEAMTLAGLKAAYADWKGMTE